MNAILERINTTGSGFVEFAWPMLLQVSVLVVILLLADLLLRSKVRAVFRYWLWMLVLVKLVLPSTLSSPLSVGSFFGEELKSLDVVTSVKVTESPEVVRLSEPFEMPGQIRPVGPESVAPKATADVGTESAVVVTWQGVVFLVWLAVVAGMGLLLLQRAIFVKGLVAQAKDANTIMNDALEFCRRRMGLKNSVRLKVSANTASPAVCGLFQPVILVPQDLAPTLGAGHLRAVLMHELAHIKRGDLWVNLVQTLLQIIYFYNPFLWLGNAIIRRVREQAVDEATLVAMGEAAERYPQTLLSVAKLALGRPALSLRLIGVVESRSALAGRVKRILSRPFPKTAKLGILGLAAVIIVGAVLLPMAKAMPKPPTFIVKGIVTDTETGQPIAGAKVGDVERYAEGKQWTTTDANGNYSYKTWYEEHAVKCEIAGYETQIKGFLPKLFGLDLEKERVVDFKLTPENPENSSRFIASLTNGVTVELVGVCEYDGESKGWLKPDGSVFDPDLYVQQREEYKGQNRLAFVVKLNTEDFNLEFNIKGVESYSGMDLYDTSDNVLHNYQAAVALIENDDDFTDLRIGVATELWKTIAQLWTAKRDVSGPNDIIFSTPIESKNGTAISVRGDWDRKLGERRVIAIDKQGKTHIGSWYGRSSWDKTISMSEFKKILPEQINKYELKFRPYEWVEFKNVSLKPNFKTDVQIEVEKSVVEVEKSTSEKSTSIEKHYQKVTFEKGTSIRDALRALGEMYKKNIIPSDKVNGQIPVNELYDVTFEEVLQAILGTHKYIVDGKFIRVYTAEEYKAIRPNFKTAVQVEVKNGSVKRPWWRISTDTPITVREITHPEGSVFYKKFNEDYLRNLLAKSFEVSAENITKSSSGKGSSPQQTHKKTGFEIPFPYDGIERHRRLVLYQGILKESVYEDIKNTLGALAGGSGAGELQQIFYNTDNTSGSINIHYSKDEENALQIIFTIQEVLTKQKSAVQVEGEGQKLVWGEEVNGLRVAVEFLPEKECYSSGEEIGVRFYVQNVSERTIAFTTAIWRNDKTNCVIQDSSGKKSEVISNIYLGDVQLIRKILSPRQIVILESASLAIAKSTAEAERFSHPVGHEAILEPGQYSLHYELLFPDVESYYPDGTRRVAKPGDWEGTLVTGKRRLCINSADESYAKPAVQAEAK